MTLRSSIIEPIKRHLHDRLPKMCDADPDALSSYILALLQRDQPMSALRDSCMTELVEFLGNQTSSFVSALFTLIGELTGEGHARTLSPSSSSYRKRHNTESSGSRSRAPYPSSSSYMSEKRHRHEDRYRSEHHRRSSSDHYRIEDDYGHSLMDIPPPLPRHHHYDDRTMPMQRPGYKDYRQSSMAPPPFAPRMHQQHSPPIGDVGPSRPRSSRWPSTSRAPSPSLVSPQQGPSTAAPPQPDQQLQPQQQQQQQQQHQQQNGQPQQGSHRQQRSPTNLFIANVPRELNTLSTMSTYFGRFGEIVNVQIKADANKAFVQFRTHSQARKALGCPEAVCNNRFIKVFWARYDPMDKGAGLASDLIDGEAAPSILDEQATLLKQQEKDAQVRRDRLQLTTEISGKQTMLSKLKSMTGENAARQATISALEAAVSQIQLKLDALPVVDDAADALVDANLATPSLQDQLAQAEKEAAAFGLVDEFGNIVHRGGRGSRGRGRGRGASRDTTGRRSSMTLDNRPKTLRIDEIPEAYLNEKMLRSHFQSFGDITRVEMGAFGERTTALVQFKTRNMAQSALSNGQSMLKHQLKLSWHEGPSPIPVNNDLGSKATVSVEPSSSVVASGDVISDDEDEEDVDRSWKR